MGLLEQELGGQNATKSQNVVMQIHMHKTQSLFQGPSIASVRAAAELETLCGKNGTRGPFLNVSVPAVGRLTAVDKRSRDS